MKNNIYPFCVEALWKTWIEERDGLSNDGRSVYCD